MSPDGEWVDLPLAIAVDLDSGGRWTSLRGGGREWLWRNPDAGVRAARLVVRPGESFVDAGGVEEALPTVRGYPDHGDVWCRPWQDLGAGWSTATWSTQDGEHPPTGSLRRRIQPVDDAVQVDYEVVGPPRAGFVHAVHALLDLSPDARVEPRGSFVTEVLDDLSSMPTPVVWPSGLDRLGPDDGSATCALLAGCRAVDIVDGPDRLSLSWSTEDARLCSVLLWRNLGGWPQPNPYRSIGIEPMVGRTADWRQGRPDDLARLGPDGTFRWSLRLRAARRRID